MVVAIAKARPSGSFRNVVTKPRTIRVSTDTLALFESLGRGEPCDWLFPSNKRNGPLTRQAVAARMARWGKAAEVHLYPHRCRHTHATHAIRRGVDVFTCNQRWVTRHQQPLVITLLPILRTAVHFGWGEVYEGSNGFLQS